jgi:hypothetical protein
VLQPRRRFAKDAVLIVDGTLVPTRDHTIAEQSKNYRYSTNYQVVIDADTRLIVVIGRPGVNLRHRVCRRCVGCIGIRGLVTPGHGSAPARPDWGTAPEGS